MCTIRVNIYHKSAFVDVLFQTNCLGIVYTGGPTSFNLNFCKTVVYSVLSSFDLNCIVQYFYFHPVWETCVGSLGLHENSRRFQFWFDTFLQPKVSELVFFCYNNKKNSSHFISYNVTCFSEGGLAPVLRYVYVTNRTLIRHNRL